LRERAAHRRQEQDGRRPDHPRSPGATGTP
jgi:hypothetical protein